MIIVCTSKEHVRWHVRLRLELFQIKNLALAVDALDIDLVEVLSGKHLLDSNLLLVLLLYLQLLKVKVPLRVQPLHLELPEIFMIGVGRDDSKYFSNEVPALIIEAADIPNLEDLVLELEFRIDLLLF